MILELTYQSEHHWAADIREEDDAQTQYNGQRNRTFRVIGFHTRCSYNIKSDERVEASRRSAEHLGQYKFHWSFHGHHQHDYFSGTYRLTTIYLLRSLFWDNRYKLPAFEWNPTGMSQLFVTTTMSTKWSKYLEFQNDIAVSSVKVKI